MSEHLSLAEIARRSGDRAAAIIQLTAALVENPAQASATYRSLLLQLYQAGDLPAGDRWSGLAVERFADQPWFWTIRGVFLRHLNRYPEALAALTAAAALAPEDPRVLVNMGNVLLLLGQGVEAESVWTQAIAHGGALSEYQRLRGRARLLQEHREDAVADFRGAVETDPHNIDAWLDLVGAVSSRDGAQTVEIAIEGALAANPDHPRLLEARILGLLRSQQIERAVALLKEAQASHPMAAWPHYQLGLALSVRDPVSSIKHFRRAVELDPNKLEHHLQLVEWSQRLDPRLAGEALEAACEAARAAVDRTGGALRPDERLVAYDIFRQAAAFEEMESLGDIRTLGRGWLNAQSPGSLLKLLPRVSSAADRHELLDLHRLWGRRLEAEADKSPIRHAAPRRAGGKIRLGLMSSDLRNHPVGYFVLPLFDHLDPERFDVFCYSFEDGPAGDAIQQHIAARATAFRQLGGAAARAAAQMIADDGLDMLVELGGVTVMNRPDVMAWRPAPVQVSWLGYPHSVGLSNIDYLICDPHNLPVRADLLLERPLVMPKSWIALGGLVFNDDKAIDPALPQDRSGRITFGTANSPYKYNARALELWARVLKAVPGSRFMFIRPEGAAEPLRRNLTAAFERHGVAADRVAFNLASGGEHLLAYNDVDITLDTLPLTGGTTTAEALWMGVPVVTLAGEAFFERLSASILHNAGLADLIAEDPDRYVQLAVDLARDHKRRLRLRSDLREQIRTGPLGQTAQFAADFYDTIARAVRTAGERPGYGI